MQKALTLATAALTAGGVMAAPAGFASADSPLETIGLLEAEGYTVIIDRVGSGLIEDCVVISVRNPNTITRFVRVGGRGGGRGDSVLVPVIVSKTIQVSLDCTS